MGKRFLWTALIFVSVVIVGSQVYAQTNAGALAGTITDPSGSAVAGAVVTASNAATGQSSKTTASSTGDYRLSELLVGNYNVSTSAPGFKTAQRTGVAVQMPPTASLAMRRLQRKR